MNTQSTIAKYNSALFAADGATSVKIGKTIYSIVDVKSADENRSSSITIKKGNTLKTLTPNTGNGWTLWSSRNGLSGRTGLPKMVTLEFI